jgi:NADPH:quinone reductase-like Zn-dependent oxidoreductase
MVRIKESPVGFPTEGSVLVRMRLCPINPSDVIPITGAYAHRVVPPLVAGYEGMGEIEAVGGTAPFARGDRVLVTKHPGTWSERLVIEHRKLIAIPDAVPDTVAARGYINPATCLLMLKKYPVAQKKVLVTGGGSACALLLDRWAQLHGAASVTVVARTDRAWARHEAGTRVIRADEGELGPAARDADLIFDGVGGAVGDVILASQRPDARFVSYGLLSGTPLDERRFGARLDRFYLRLEQEQYSDDAWRELFQEIWRLVEAVPPPEAELFPFEKVREALEYFYSDHRERKPVLCMGSYTA